MGSNTRLCNTCGCPCHGKQCRDCYEGEKYKGRVCLLKPRNSFGMVVRDG